MASTTVSNSPVTSWWYGQGRAVDVVRRLESLYALTPSPGAAGVVTASRDELTVTFVEKLKENLPPPWHPDGQQQARIPLDVVDPGSQPDPDHPVYLVVFGTTDGDTLVGLNLAAFSRVRFDGDPAAATALVSRWVLELLATHPGITIGVTADVWRGPLTTRVRPVAAGRVPDVDVLVCGADLTYAERAQIVSAATSPILLDLGKDAAVNTTWTITCGPDRHGQICRGSSRPMTATLIIPTADTVDRCSELLAGPSSEDAGASPEPTFTPPASGDHDGAFEPYTGADDPDPDPDLPAAPLDGLDFFAPHPATPPPADLVEVSAFAASDAVEHSDVTHWPAKEYSNDGANPADIAVPPDAMGSAEPINSAAPVIPGGAAAEETEDAAAPVLAPIWNRILGQVDLRPPHDATEPGPREKRLNELTVFLQYNPWVGSSEIIRRVYGGAASDKTVTQQVSMLRARLGVVRPGGPKALPPMREGGYHLDNAVRSDWMEFERLVEILVEATPTANLIAAMNLVTGPPLGGIPPKEWAWTQDLRDELRDRVAGAAVVLARRHHSAKQFAAAVENARKGLWYDNARQDLWQVSLEAALDGHDKDAFRTLRSQFLSAVPGPNRDPAVFDLTGRAG